MSRRSTERPVADAPAAVQIPYRAHLAPRVVNTAAGDYVMSWRLTGLSFECADDAEINAAHERLNSWLRNMSSPEVAIWSHVVRRREYALPAADAPPGFSRRLLRRYRRRLECETLWTNELYVTLVYRPLGARVVGAAVALAARHGTAIAADNQVAGLTTAMKLASQLEAALEAYEPLPLECYEHDGRRYSALLEFLALLTNGEARRFPLPRSSIDEVLGTTRLLIGWETVEYRVPLQRHARLLRERGVARLVSWISGEVLGRAELQRVHERRHDDQIALGARGAQQRQMAVVERPHRWNEAHAQPRVRRRRKRPAKLGDRTDGSHLRRSSSHRDTGRD